MPAPSVSRRFFSPSASPLTLDMENVTLDEPPLLNFEDLVHVDATSAQNDMMFGPLDLEDNYSYDEHHSINHHRDSSSELDSENPSPHYFTSPLSPHPNVASPDDVHFDSGGFYSPKSPTYTDQFADSYVHDWNKGLQAAPAMSSSAPIPIPYGNNDSAAARAYLPFPTFESPTYPQNASFSPSEFMTNQPLPLSDPSSYNFTNPMAMEDQAVANEYTTYSTADPSMLIGQQTTPYTQGDISRSQPGWASELWGSPTFARSATTIRQTRHSLHPDHHRRRAISQRGSVLTQLFTSSSAPTAVPPIVSRSYSRKAEYSTEDNDATIRRRRSPPSQTDDTKNGDGPALKSLLRPPKLAPSAWQLYFTDWIQKHQASSSRKLNVAQAAKEAGQEYATLTAEEKEPYKRRSQAAKEQRERELAAYMKTLTPDDIKRENVFRAEQRKLGRSRKSNIKDPNAPKKPLSAYFMFLQWIRADPTLVQEIFGDESETTKQSVLAAARWRSMTDEQRKPFLAQAEQEKIEYESARRMYEEGTTGSANSINFSILPGNLAERALGTKNAFKFEDVKAEPESDGEVSNGDSFHLSR